MSENNPVERLRSFTTAWTSCFQAHAKSPAEASPAARRRLLERYGVPVRRYLRAVVRDPAAADELYQKFTQRMVHGDLHTANPERGRFRDFLQTELSHLVVEYQCREARQSADGSSTEPPAATEPDDAFTRSWREQILVRGWKALAEHEKATGQPVHTVLRYRADHPEAKSAEMADALSFRLGQPIDVEWVRRRLYQAREHFSDLVIADVAGTLDPATVAAVAEELLDLNLLDYCRDALERYRISLKAPPR